jgi:serine/tyrosine/threonine adenylyltransferase
MKIDCTYTSLGKSFYSAIDPIAVFKPKLISFNHQLANELGIDLKDKTELELAQFFSGNALLPGSRPIALNYSGHQFGHFNPQLGDGRAVLLGEINSPQGQRFDIQLKGSGRTPYSRNGDGRSALGPVIREYLMSEAMHQLGIPTTRALCAVESGEQVQREGLLKGGVFTRVASSHIRVGTFEYFSSRSMNDELKQLADYTIQRHYPEIHEAQNPYLELFRSFSQRYLKLVSNWMRIGFIHGVMNTDNTALSGETIDYGPCAFMDVYKHDQVFSFIDRQARYNYSNQGPIACWNLSAFASAIIPLIHNETHKAITILEEELSKLPSLFEQDWLSAMASKLGILKPNLIEHRPIITAWLSYLEDNKLDFTNSHRSLMNTIDNQDFPAIENQDFYHQLKSIYSNQDSEQTEKLMAKSNPYIIPRNHQIEQAIEKSYIGDYNHFNKLGEVFSRPYETNELMMPYTDPPIKTDKNYKTFCGT